MNGLFPERIVCWLRGHAWRDTAGVHAEVRPGVWRPMQCCDRCRATRVSA